MAQFGLRPIQQDPLEYAGQKTATIPTIDAPRAPTVLDRQFPIQTIWRDNTTNDEWILVDVISGNAQWRLFTGGGAGSVTNLRADDGNIAVPNVGVIDVDGNTVAAGTNPTPFYTTAAVANTVDFDIQVASAQAASNINNAGLASFDNTQFAVDAAGFVTLAGGGLAVDQINVDANTPPGTDPVIPDGTGEITIAGTAVVAHAVPIETHSRALNAFNIEVQVAVDRTGAPGNRNDAGLCSFNDTMFTVDADGYVSLTGGGIAVDQINVDANTPPGTDPVIPDGTGEITISGAAVAAHTTPVESHSRALNAFNIEVQVGSDIATAPGNTDDAGLISADSNHFTIDADGFTQLNDAVLTQSWANLGVGYAAGTFTIFDEDGDALSATNKAFAKISSKDAPGKKLIVEITKPYRFRDDANGVASDIEGWYPFHNTGDDWDEDRPFFLYVITHDTPTSDPAFGISLCPTYRTSPAAALINTSASITSQDYVSMFLLDIDDGGYTAPTIANYDQNPCLLVGSFRMQITDTVNDDWTVTTLDNSDGIGHFQQDRIFTFPDTGVIGCSANSYFLPNGGTAPTGATARLYYYKVRLDGTVLCKVAYTGNANAGVGAVTLQMGLPYYLGISLGFTPGGTGTWIDTNLFKQIWPCLAVAADPRFSGNGREAEFIFNDGTGNFLQNQHIAGSGADDIRCSFEYTAFGIT